MKILVCIKQVVSRDSPVRIDAARPWVREDGVSWELNEPDAYALEEALRLKEAHGGEVVVVSVGPARVTQVLREALARGADRAIHAQREDTGATDALSTARALAATVQPERPDLVLTGLQSDDLGLGQVGVVLAELLGVSHSTIIMEIAIEGAALRVKRELEGGWFQWVSMPRPAVLTIQSGINQLRYATLRGIMAAKRKDIQIVPAPASGTASHRIVAVYAPERTRQTRMLSGHASDVAAELVRSLREEARVL